MKDIFLDDLHEKSDIKKLISSLGNKDIASVSIKYTSDFKNTKKIRKIVDGLCISKKISPRWRTRLVLISDELNNNAIEYGSAEGDINTFVISIDGKKVYISVSDCGSGENSKNAGQMKEVREKFQNINYSEHDSIRGRGLFLIIGTLVDSLKFHDNKEGGLTVEISKDLS